METKQALSALSALAHETRLTVFRLLVRQGPEGMPAGEVAQRLGVPAPTLSFHLKELERAGLIRARAGTATSSTPSTTPAPAPCSTS